MQIKWQNLIALGVVVFAINLLFKNAGPVAETLGSIRAIAPGSDPGDRVVGLIVVAVLMVTLLMLVRLLLQKDQKP